MDNFFKTHRFYLACCEKRLESPFCEYGHDELSYIAVNQIENRVFACCEMY